jgi:radical SAM superfamily enzyme YgiQ (UPF0313 family)
MDECTSIGEHPLNRNNGEESPDLLLVNSLAPRQRSLSDTALENSLAILRTYLEDRGFAVEVIDHLRLDSLREGLSPWRVAFLRRVIRRQMTAYAAGSKILALFFMLVAWPFQSHALLKRNAYMESLIGRVVARVKQSDIPLVGIKLWYGDSFRWGDRLAARIRAECPGAVVIAGGPQVSVHRERILEESSFDLAVMGPGEEVLERLLRLRRAAVGRKVFLDRVLHESGGTRMLTKDGPLAKAPRLEPPREGTIIPRYREEDLQGKVLFHTLVDGYGCTWNKCHFCASARLYAHYRPRPADQIITEIKEMVRKGIVFFRFSSPDTPLPHGRRIAEAILDSGLWVRYSMFTRSTEVTEERFDAYRTMISSGLRVVFTGGETGHDLVNERVMNKGTTRQEIIDTIGAIRKAARSVGERCMVGLSLIYPCPLPEGVTLDQVFGADLSLIKETKPDTVIINPPVAFPETAWFEEPRRFGFIFGRDFASALMKYEYASCKPPELWPKIDISLQGLGMEAILSETGRLRREVAALGIPTEIADEDLMVADAVGIVTRKDLLEFKRESLVDIISGSVAYSRKIINKINRRGSASALAQRELVSEDLSHTRAAARVPAHPEALSGSSFIKAPC